MPSLATRQQVALRLAHDGYSLRQIEESTGLRKSELEELFRLHRPTDPRICGKTGCGQTRNTPGRPIRGWIKVAMTTEEARWFCSWLCVARFASTAAGRPAA
ncbi:MAG: hypothetical protein ACXV2H_07130 [Actinomycetes bacterium]